MLSVDFSRWEIVYYYFSVWSKADDAGDSVLDRALKKWCTDFETTTSARIKRHAQSVQSADTAEEKGYDAGEKTSGIKRRIAVDTQGLLPFNSPIMNISGV